MRRLTRRGGKGSGRLGTLPHSERRAGAGRRVVGVGGRGHVPWREEQGAPPLRCRNGPRRRNGSPRRGVAPPTAKRHHRMLRPALAPAWACRPHNWRPGPRPNAGQIARVRQVNRTTQFMSFIHAREVHEGLYCTSPPLCCCSDESARPSPPISAIWSNRQGEPRQEISPHCTASFSHSHPPLREEACTARAARGQSMPERLGHAPAASAPSTAGLAIRTPLCHRIRVPRTAPSPLAARPPPRLLSLSPAAAPLPHSDHPAPPAVAPLHLLRPRPTSYRSLQPTACCLAPLFTCRPASLAAAPPRDPPPPRRY